MKTLPIALDTFGFVEREKKHGKPVIFRCGRDFLYYALTYYKPEVFNPRALCPTEIERKSVFGLRLPWWLMWSALQFTRVPNLLQQNGLYLTINGTTIQQYGNFFLAHAYPKKISPIEALTAVEKSVDAGVASAIDIDIGLCGLVDHVLFVYGYDDENLFVFDTQKLPGLEYEKQTREGDSRFFMKLPKDVVRARWTRWGRVWVVAPSRDGNIL
jgi:hypothetical protein